MIDWDKFEERLMLTLFFLTLGIIISFAYFKKTTPECIHPRCALLESVLKEKLNSLPANMINADMFMSFKKVEGKWERVLSKR